MKKLLLPILLLTVCSLLIACGDDSNPEETIYTITFDLNEGDAGGPTSEEVRYNSPLPDISGYSEPTRVGYFFAGYFDIDNERYYYADLTPAIDYWDKKEDATLYAHWTGNPYTITFNANEGTGGQTESLTATFGSPMPAITEAPTRTGFTFTGYFDAETDGIRYYNADLTSARNWDKASGDTLYAQWDFLYDLGDEGPGGGIIFYVSEEGFEVTGYGTAYYLESAPADMATTLSWSGQNTLIGGTGTAIGTGRDNTDRIHATIFSTPTASACRNYTGGGLTDWFLPSRDELYQLYLQRNVVGGFSADFYWSSSENNYIDAWLQNFSDGSQFIDVKIGEDRVRAIRAF